MIELTAREQVPPPSPKTVAMGVDRARALMVHVIRNERVCRSKIGFGPGLLQSLHKQVLFYYPGWAGQLRVDDQTRVGGRVPAKAEELPDKTYLFERWLEREVDTLREDPEDLQGALRVASAAHYGLVADLHPFDDGNGRVARIVMNGILMTESREARAYNKFIIPVPILRDQINEQELGRMLMEGREPKTIPYLQALRDVDNTWLLNPLEIHIAGRWVQSMDRFLDEVRVKMSRRSWRKLLTNADLSIVDKMEDRKLKLERFIAEHMNGRMDVDRVPNYFTTS